MLFSVQAWGLFCLFIGCGSTGFYNQQSWVPAGDGEGNEEETFLKCMDTLDWKRK